MRINRSTLIAIIATASIVGFPIVAGFSEILNISSTPLSLTMRSILFILALFLILSAPHSVMSKGLKIKISIIIAFWIYYSFRIFDYTVLYPELSRESLFFYAMWGYGSSLIPIFSILSCLSYYNSERTLQFISVGTLIALILVIANGSTYVIRSGETIDTQRLQLESLNAISLGRVGAIAMVLATWYYLYRHTGSKRVFLSLAAVFAWLGGAYLLFFSGSRGTMIAAVIAMLCLILPRMRRGSFRALGIPTLLALISVFYVVYFTPPAVEGIINRIVATGQVSDLSSHGRMLSYSGAWGVFVQNPILGGRMEEPISNFYPHNFFLEILMSTGFIGFALFLYIILVCLSLAFKLLKIRRADSWAAPLFVFFLIQGMFSGAIYQAHEFWVSIALVLVTPRRSLLPKHRISKVQPICAQPR